MAISYYCIILLIVFADEETTFPSVCLDTNVDLFNFLEHDTIPQQDVSPVVLQLDNSIDCQKPPSADDVMKVSELLLANLNAAQALSDESGPAANQNTLDLSSLHNLTGENSMLSDDEVDSILSGNNDQVDSLLSNSSDMLAADILSPVSPKDVEDILSMSAATSPYSITASSPCSSNANASSPYPTSPYSLDSFQSENSAAETSEGIPTTISMKYLREELLKPPPPPKTTITEDEGQVVERSRQKCSRRQRVKYEPYSPPPVGRSQKNATHSRGQPEAKCTENRNQRKKQQNKDAALRYRQKKREEKCTIKDECDKLEERNDELKDKVDSMTREIQYLKDLLAEVYKAKGIAESK